MTLSKLSVALLGLQVAGVLSQDQATCSLENKCPESAPCCSQYGQCGVGAYCLGGCDPRMSFSLDSCVPAPVCQSKKYTMNSMDGIVDISKYLGDASTADWVSQGEPRLFKDNIILTMPPRSVGTVLASTSYMWYGSVKAKLKTSVDAGVVTAFILLSDVKDEIDYEFVGVDLGNAQTNYYFQGIPKYDQGANISLSNTYENFHEYEIKWTPDEITWLVDGQVGRTKKRSDTWNETANQWDFPQTPSRVQLSIWPGGADTNAEGTIQWAGGPINWDSQYIKDHGYYFATFAEVEVDCFNADSPPGTNKGTSYWYNDIRATNDTVEDGDKSTVIKSLQATGLDMNKGEKTDNENTQSVPGGTSGGTGQSVGKDSSSSSTGDSSSGDSSSSSSDGGSSCSASSFSQNCDGSGNSAAGLHVSAVAVMTILAAVSAFVMF